MKIQGKQITVDETLANAVFTAKGLTSVLLTQLTTMAQNEVVSVVTVNNDTGPVSIPSPAAGTCYRCTYPTTSITIGGVAQGTSIWIEFMCGDVSGGSFSFVGSQTIYFEYAVGNDGIGFEEGSYYQLQVKNVLGRTYASLMNTQLLAPSE